MEIITPDWPAPANVKAVSTTRHGGVSNEAFSSLNLGLHVGDDAQAVSRNRQRLRTQLALPAEPVWLQQVHGIRVLDLDREHPALPEADGSTTAVAGRVCVVMTADCLPVLLCNQAGTRVAAVHAGWRGLAAGVLEAGIEAMGGAGQGLLAWLGPAIGSQHFEVGAEVRAAFTHWQPQAAAAFREAENEKFLADLYHLARLRLRHAGVGQVFGGDACTFSEADRFYSYRRDGKTGRMASLIWLQ